MINDINDTNDCLLSLYPSCTKITEPVLPYRRAADRGVVAVVAAAVAVAAHVFSMRPVTAVESLDSR